MWDMCIFLCILACGRRSRKALFKWQTEEVKERYKFVKDVQTIKELEKKKKSKRQNGENILIGHRVILSYTY